MRSWIRLACSRSPATDTVAVRQAVARTIQLGNVFAKRLQIIFETVMASVLN